MRFEPPIANGSGVRRFSAAPIENAIGAALLFIKLGVNVLDALDAGGMPVFAEQQNMISQNKRALPRHAYMVNRM